MYRKYLIKLNISQFVKAIKIIYLFRYANEENDRVIIIIIFIFFCFFVFHNYNYNYKKQKNKKISKRKYIKINSSLNICHLAIVFPKILHVIIIIINNY